VPRMLHAVRVPHANLPPTFVPLLSLFDPQEQRPRSLPHLSSPLLSSSPSPSPSPSLLATPSDKHGSTRIPYRFLYTASCYGGLLPVLTQWRTLRARFPTATLEVCGGWPLEGEDEELRQNTSHDNRFHDDDDDDDDNEETKTGDGEYNGGYDDEDDMDRIQIQNAVLDLKEHGVTECGRVGACALIQKTLTADFWIHAPRSEDVSNAATTAALKAQVAGCLPVVVRPMNANKTIVRGYITSRRSGLLDQMLRACTERGTPEQETARRDMVVVMRKKWNWERIGREWVKALSLSFSSSP